MVWRFCTASRSPTDLGRRSEALLWSLQSFATHAQSWQTFFLSASLVWHLKLRQPRSPLSNTDVCRLRRIGGSRRMLSSMAPTERLEKAFVILQEALTQENGQNLSEIGKTWIEIMKSGNEKLKDRALQLRGTLYKKLIAGYDEKCYEIMVALFSHVPDTRLTAKDYKFRTSVLVRAGEIDVAALALMDSTTRLSKHEYVEVLKSIVNDLMCSSEVNRERICIDLFCSTVLKYSTTLELLKSGRYFVEREILRSILVRSESIISILTERISNNPLFGSMVATTCLDLFGREPSSFADAMAIWNLKKQLNVAMPIDLHRIMTAQYMNGKYEAALELYDVNKKLHASWQFDIVLLSVAKTRDWDRLQTVFESLFRYDRLPDLKHYGIVMQALSQLGKIDIVETLFAGLLDRSLYPTVEIFHTLMYTRLSLGDTQGVEYYFKKMAEFDLTPNEKSYLILLLSYRDARDSEKALSLVGEMAQMGVPLTRHLVATLLSLCTERRDSATAWAIFNWAQSYGIKPDVVGYNAMITCLMESDETRKAEEVYSTLKTAMSPRIDTLTSMLVGYSRSGSDKVQDLFRDMKKYRLEPDERWYASLMSYFVNKKDFENAESTFKEIESTGVDRNAYHYTIMMEAYRVQKRFKEVEKLFADMKERNITPTYATQATYLRMKTSHPSAIVRREADDILQAFLDSKDILDLHSKQLPRNVVPISMLKQVVREKIKLGDYSAALLFLKPYVDSGSYDRHEQFKVPALQLEVYRHAGYWSLVDETWDQFVTQLREIFVPKRQADGSYTKKVPTRYSNDFWKQIDCKLNQLQHYGRTSSMLEFAQWARHAGFRFGSKNINTLVRGLIADDDFLLEGLRIAEKELAPGYLVRKSMRKLKRRDMPRDMGLCLSTGTVKQIIKRWEKAISLIAYEQKCTELKASELVNERYPSLLRAAKLYHRRRDGKGRKRDALAD
jgi:pentatricopeptide repeat protein